MPRHEDGMLASDLRDILIREIVKARGGGITRWRKAVGQLKVYSRSTHAHCNWEARPVGTVAEIAVIERAVDDIRLLYPYVDEG